VPLDASLIRLAMPGAERKSFRGQGAPGSRWPLPDAA
jgi:hypothetical protein